MHEEGPYNIIVDSTPRNVVVSGAATTNGGTYDLVASLNAGALRPSPAAGGSKLRKSPLPVIMFPFLLIVV
jgi:hypothetical protein